MPDLLELKCEGGRPRTASDWQRDNTVDLLTSIYCATEQSENPINLLQSPTPTVKQEIYQILLISMTADALANAI